MVLTGTERSKVASDMSVASAGEAGRAEGQLASLLPHGLSRRARHFLVARLRYGEKGSFQDIPQHRLAVVYWPRQVTVSPDSVGGKTDPSS